MTLVVQDLKFNYGEQPVLQEISFSIEPGEIVAVLGRNGAGKSTLVRCIAGFLKPVSGRIRAGENRTVDGIGVPRHMFNFSFQELAVYPGLTVRDNFTLFGELAGLKEREISAKLEQDCARFSIEHLIDQKLSHLSTGQKRIVHNCVSFLAPRSFAIMDEPTAGLDIDSRERTLAYVKEYAERGIGVLYCTHYLPEVETLNAKVVLLHRGKVIAEGSLEELGRRYSEKGVRIYFAKAADCEFIADRMNLPIPLESNCLVLRGDQATDQIIAVLNVANARGIDIRSIDFENSGIESVFHKATGERFEETDSSRLSAK